MRRLPVWGLLLVVAPLLAACGPGVVQTDVTRFHDFEPSPAPRSFTILPDRDQVGSLEFQRYAELVAAALRARGWHPVESGGGAKAVVTVRWGVGEPSAVITQSPSPNFGLGFGSGRHGHGVGFGIGMPLGRYDWDTRVVNTFPKWLEVTIADAESRRVLFEGRAITEGTRREIAPVVPYLVRALFTAFPGASGSTVRIGVPADPPAESP